MWTAVALKLATTSSPVFKFKSDAERLVIAATKGNPQSKVILATAPRGSIFLTFPEK